MHSSGQDAAALRAAEQRRRADDTKIMQKVNAVNREAFIQRFPGQLEHMMRLVSERLQFVLNKHNDTDLTRPETWPATPAELASLASALRDLDEIHQRWHPDDQEA